MNPILKYSGGKAKEIKFFKKYIPKFDTYIEPFFGGGAVYFYLEPEKAIINDINHRLIEFYVDLVKEYAKTRKELDFLGKEYKINRTAFEEKKRQYPDEKVPDANEHIYYEIRDMFNKKIDPQYTYATIYYYINKTAYSGMIRYNKAGEYNVPYGRYKNFNTHLLTDNHLNLKSYSRDFYGYTAMWKALEYELSSHKIKGDLVQLNGYYQYSPKMQISGSFDSSFPINSKLMKSIMSNDITSKLLTIDNMVEIVTMDPNELKLNLKTLKEMGYEVRNENTNVQIPQGHWMIPYAFPTLSNLSVQMYKRL